MFMFNIKDMLWIHFGVGIGVTIFFVLRSIKKNYTRHFLNFGSGVLGEQNRWIQWYSWILGAELLSSVLYIHTGMFYFELGFSFIESIVATLGAFIVDRFSMVFNGEVEVNRPKFKITVPSISNPFKRMGAKVKESTEVYEPDRTQQKQAFDDLTRDN